VPRRSSCPWPVRVLPTAVVRHLRPRAPQQRTLAYMRCPRVCWSRTLAHRGAHTLAQRCVSPAWPEPYVLRTVRRTLACLPPALSVAGRCPLRSDGPCARPPRHGQALVAIGVRRGRWVCPSDLARSQATLHGATVGQGRCAATRPRCPSSAARESACAAGPLRRSGGRGCPRAGAPRQEREGHGVDPPSQPMP